MKYLSKKFIIHINKRTTKAHGGSFIAPNNILKGDNLDYLLDAVMAEMFEAPLYPEIFQKAAVYFYTIINGHIFNDGNKRTALESALIFLELNGFRIKIKINNLTLTETEKIDFSNEKNNVLFQFTNYFASGLGDLDLCIEWFKENIEPI